MRSISLILILLLLSFQGRSQNSAEEKTELFKGLQNAIKSGDSLDMARNYRKIGISFIYESSIDSAIFYLEKGLYIAKAIQHPKAQGAIYNNLAECYSKLGNNEKALEVYQESAAMFLSLPDSIAYAGVLINISSVYDETGQAKQAIENALKAIEVKEVIGDSAQLAFYYNKVAELFEKIDSPKHSHYLLKAYSLSRYPNATTFYINISIFNNMGLLASKNGNIPDALAYYDTLYHLAFVNNHVDGMEIGLSNQASLYLRLGDLQKSSQLYKQAVTASEKSQNVYRKIDNLLSAGRIENRLENYHAAIPLLAKASTSARQHNYPKFEQEALEALSQSYQKTARWEQAFQALKQSRELKDSLESQEIKEYLHELETRYETEKKAKQIELLTATNLYNQKQKKTLTGLLAASILMMTAIGLYLSMRSRALRQAKEMAEQKNQIYKLGQEKIQMALDQKNRELSAMALQMAQKTELLSDVKKSISEGSENLQNYIREIDRQMNPDADWEAFKFHFQEVHTNFFISLKKQFPDITPNEERLCAYLKLNLPSKKIAQLNNNTVAAVDKSRNRLRKKLNLEPEVSIKDFLDQIT